MRLAVAAVLFAIGSWSAGCREAGAQDEPRVRIIDGGVAIGGRGILTDRNLEAFAVYERAMAPVLSGDARPAEAGEVGSPAAVEWVEAAHREALRRSGLSEREMLTLSQLAGEYYGRLSVVRQAGAQAAALEARIADARRRDQKPSEFDQAMLEMYRQQEADFEKYRRELGAQVGPEGLSSLERHQTVFLELIQAPTGQDPRTTVTEPAHPEP